MFYIYIYIYILYRRGEERSALLRVLKAVARDGASVVGEEVAPVALVELALRKVRDARVKGGLCA